MSPVDERDLLVFGHGKFGEALLRAGLIDVLDLSVHPVVLGRGELFFREGQHTELKLVAVRSFSRIVRLSYEPVR